MKPEVRVGPLRLKIASAEILTQSFMSLLQETDPSWCDVVVTARFLMEAIKGGEHFVFCADKDYFLIVIQNPSD